MRAADLEMVQSDTERWVRHAVIGLNLCPFAKSVQVKGQIHYAVSAATEPNTLLQALENECSGLLDLPIAQRETTLLMAPHCLADFLEFNDFLDRVDVMLATRQWDGVLQVASFHPEYQFAGTAVNDVTNLTNWAPYPTLHILREASIDRAVEVFPDAAQIYATNTETMQTLGHEGWAALGLQRSLP
jgi:uncharacterized protein